MQKTLSALIFEEQGWHIAQCIEIDVASQGNTSDEAFLNLQEAINLHLQKPTSTISAPFAKSTEIALQGQPDASIIQWIIANE